jgi:hypothetical protein
MSFQAVVRRASSRITSGRDQKRSGAKGLSPETTTAGLHAVECLQTCVSRVSSARCP